MFEHAYQLAVLVLQRVRVFAETDPRPEDHSAHLQTQPSISRVETTSIPVTIYAPQLQNKVIGSDVGRMRTHVKQIAAELERAGRGAERATVEIEAHRDDLHGQDHLRACEIR